MSPLDDPILRTTFSAVCGVPAHTPTLAVRDGIAYVQTHRLEHEVKALAAAGPVVLVTHGSDAPANILRAAVLPANVRSWFSMNSTTALAHPLPIGLRSDSAACPLLAALRDAGMVEYHRRNPLYLCCTWNTPNLPEHVRVERQKLYDQFTWATREGGNSIGDVPFDHFSLRLRQHRYVLCPRGAGYDSHRIWEAMYLGCIPVVRRSAWSERMAEFAPPWLRVHDWSQVTPDLLEREYPRLSAALAAWSDKLRADYWLGRIRGAM